ncbi:hypothetical protein [Gloeothece verrucosa]|uniref:Uncharacterized protein n=1 Tax=Gloeothece verrucosa (strain PCC 7822) TaxID=497965 RepID=E0UEE7_GLOV7|nr:hypothetical protein [Gloeothece verrucosa]ADN15393.1 hypothetical protein Cyan7822_3445 [Gloeothece verrucosa PCC 7822]
MKPNRLKTDIDQELKLLLKGLLTHGQNQPELIGLVTEITAERDSFWQKQFILAAIIDYMFEHLSEMNRLQEDIPNLKDKILTEVNNEYSKTSIEELQSSQKN